VEPLFLVGPTAVGKSAVALELVRLLDAEIVSADSMQVYRGMDIGTAKPTPRERAAIPHHVIDVCEVNEVFDAKRFVNLATSVISSLKSRGKSALIVGGTGLYIRALRRGLFEGPARDPKLRAKLECKSAAELFAELERVDSRSAAKIDRHNPRRLMRALEVFHATGRSISDLQTQWTQDKPSPSFCLSREREELYARIECRIDEQMAAGWVEEVRRLLTHGLEQNATAMQAAGYRELVEHLQGKLSLADAIALIKTRTRQLAKRQLTWFRREPGLRYVEVESDELPAQTARRILRFLQETEATR
jgi:tRNA dimethylallyltransferase